MCDKYYIANRMSLIDELPAEIYNKIVFIKASNNYKETYETLYSYVVMTIESQIYDIVDNALTFYNNYKDEEDLIKHSLINDNIIRRVLNNDIVKRLNYVEIIANSINTLEKIDGKELTNYEGIMNNLINIILSDFNNKCVIKIVKYIIKNYNEINEKMNYLEDDYEYDMFLDELIEEIVKKEYIAEFMT